jgi:carboxymethylenebutenolidase
MMNLFQTYLVEEFAEEYQEGRLTRREALKLIGSVIGSAVLASSFLAACSPTMTGNPAASTPRTSVPAGIAQTTPAAAVLSSQPVVSEIQPSASSALATNPASGTVSPDDPAVTAMAVEFPDDGSMIKGYLARPNESGSFPIILVCHENRGLTEHIQDVTRRLAKAGYAALAVDLLSRLGGSAALGTDQVPGALGNIAPAQFAADFQSGYRYMISQPFTQAERLGMVGFCFGGGVTWLVATAMPELKAAVPFYGPPPPVADVPKINAAVLAIYGGNDERINQTIPAIEEAMKANHKIYEKVVYPNADHGFHNDTSSRYNPEAAQDAWRRTLEWFGRYV